LLIPALYKSLTNLLIYLFT